ncbi:transmembrane protein 51a [Aplochiton taeniatus]
MIRPPNNSSSNNNNNNSEGNSGSQYALCALGVGLVALGIVMIVWSIVPADLAGNNNNNSSSSSDGSGNGGRPDNRSKASSVAFVLVGGGVVMLLLALCLGMRNKQREQRLLRDTQNARAEAGGQEETAVEQDERYTVPSYEEVVGSGQYPVRQSNLCHSPSQLPAYDDLVKVDGVQFECEGSEISPAGQPTPTAAAVPNCTPGKTSRMHLPLKIRRIKSEKTHMSNEDDSQPPVGFSIEPLTPPPQYDEKVPPL